MDGRRVVSRAQMNKRHIESFCSAPKKLSPDVFCFVLKCLVIFENPEFSHILEFEMSALSIMGEFDDRDYPA
jgi:hypothetical protein